jgi:hypothetical protein
VILFLLLWAAALTAQGGSAPAVPPTPPVRVNVINVCSPSAEEQKEISDTLARVPRQPLFSEDFEISRGRSTLPDKPGFVQSGESVRFSAEPVVADWVRIRREFSVQATFANVQYSFSRDRQFMVETLVLRVRDPKDVLQVAIENSAANVTDAATMLAAPIPISRVKLERFGKASVVLARCSGDNAADQPAPDQSVYAPLFQSASSILTSYRNLLVARRTVPDELARVAGSPTPKPRAAAKPKSPPAKP